ncbi:CPBP family intramembrane glutamic endopeptidase [Streptococcus ferus]|uniref:Metal-dependent CAAX amino terminal membrane protease n=1 Tax=Streptococcus ferus TaxID=1345 RepID=A0A2X3VCQ1_9STRE|nr:type II CAAX endopeptidase family protein [Streptococcus ferus]SQF39200.1 metal-dependent CAAX amino terminal membrane protease [Streptococcus ferus]
MHISLFYWSNKKRPMEASCLFVSFYALNFFLIQNLPSSPIITRLSLSYASDLLITSIDVSTLLLLLYVMRRRGFELSDKILQKGLKTLIVIGFIAFVSILVSDSTFRYIMPSPPIGPLSYDERIATFFIEFIIAVISGPIFEEVLFRGLLLKYVFTDCPIIGLVISTILFVIAHPTVDWTGYWYYGVPAMVLGLAYLYTKSIKVPVVVHMAINLLSHIQLKFF